MKVTATERKLVEAYREATSDNKKRAMKVLKDQDDSLAGSVGEVLGGSSITITGTGVVAQNVQTDVSASFTSANSGMIIVYDATAKTLVAQ